ncbi:MAG: CAP domain-containing protein [bacterium]|nr:CAP domain-containing protein [bacterium]
MWNFLKHLFTPHHTNNHRPKLLHPQAFVFYIAFFLLLQALFINLRTIAPNILGFATDINVEQLLSFTNQKRVAAGLEPLTLDPQLSQAAAGKAQDMFGKDYWAHNSPDDLTPWVFIKNAGYDYFYAGENLAKNFPNSQGVVDAWMASPGHRTNLLKPEYRDIGFAVVNGKIGGEETTLVVQMFGSKHGAKTIAQSSKPSAPVVSVEASPTPTVGVAVRVAPEKPIAAVEAYSVKSNPSFNLFSLTRYSSLSLIGSLMIILVMDALIVWRRKTVRAVGHNFAHFLFLAIMMGAILAVRQGGVH